MDHSYDDMILLERFLERSLDPAEAKEVERRLAEEPALMELLKQEKMLVKGIRYGHLKNKLDDLKALETSMPSVRGEEEKTKVIAFRSYWKPLALAASVALIALTLFLVNRPVAPQTLYAQYFEPYPNIFEAHTRSNENQVSEAYDAYDHENYAEAAKGFKEMLGQDLAPADRQAVLLLLGNANLMLNRTEEARDNFITLSKEFNDLNHHAKWYLSLCYLKLGKRDSAKVLLQELAAEESAHRDRAKEMLKKL